MVTPLQMASTACGTRKTAAVNAEVCSAINTKEAVLVFEQNSDIFK
jgi:hypothetical protein